MIRDIKFRAWYKPDLELGNFIKFDTVYSNDTVRFEWNDNLGNHPFTYDFSTALADDNWIKEQYTGLKDKNGFEIYDGDIIKVEIDLTSVGDGLISYTKVVNMEFESLNRLYQSLVNGAEVELVGNIHENKELLK